jgi:hypothetical protein
MNQLILLLSLLGSALSQTVTLTATPPYDCAACCLIYNIYRSITPNACPGIPYASIVGPVFVDPNVTVGATYYYDMTAKDIGGESSCSDEVQVTVQ